MKKKLFLFVFIAVSCGQVSNKSTEKSNSQDSIKKTETVTITDTISSQSDVKKTEDLQDFWNNAVVPIIKGNKNIVMTNMEFPVLGHWTQMMELTKSPNSATFEDFSGIYDKFFNSDFIKDLSKKDYKDGFTYLANDTIWYAFGVSKELGQTEGGVQLSFYKKDGKYRLKNIQGVGANFYYKETE